MVVHHHHHHHHATHWLDARDLPALRRYKYSASDASLVSKYVLQPYWTSAAKLLPRCIAPNTLTLLGLACTVGAYGVMAWHAPNLSSEGGKISIPSWVYVFMAVMTFMYQTLDALDGKQARATGMSGPLGELFDHGCDSVNLTFMTLLGLSAVDYGAHGPLTVFGLVLYSVGFCTSTWEAFHTGTLALPVINGPVEGTLISVATMLVTAVWGPAWWHVPLTSGAYVVTRRDAFVAFALVSATATVLLSVSTVVRKVWGDALARGGDRVESAFASVLAVLELTPVLLFGALVLGWAHYSPAGVASAHPHLFLLGAGFAFAHFTDRIVIAHLLKKKTFPTPWWIHTVPAVAAANAYFVSAHGAEPAFPEARVLFGFAYLSIASYLIMASFVVRDITNYLGIKCFTVTTTAAKKQD